MYSEIHWVSENQCFSSTHPKFPKTSCPSLFYRLILFMTSSLAEGFTFTRMHPSVDTSSVNTCFTGKHSLTPGLILWPGQIIRALFFSRMAAIFSRRYFSQHRPLKKSAIYLACNLKHRPVMLYSHTQIEFRLISHLCLGKDMQVRRSWQFSQHRWEFRIVPVCFKELAHSPEILCWKTPYHRTQIHARPIHAASRRPVHPLKTNPLNLRLWVPAVIVG